MADLAHFLFFFFFFFFFFFENNEFGFIIVLLFNKNDCKNFEHELRELMFATDCC